MSDDEFSLFVDDNPASSLEQSHGGEDDDTITGGAGDDTLFAGDGKDTINAGLKQPGSRTA